MQDEGMPTIIAVVVGAVIVGAIVFAGLIVNAIL